MQRRSAVISWCSVGITEAPTSVIPPSPLRPGSLNKSAMFALVNSTPNALKLKDQGLAVR